MLEEFLRLFSQATKRFMLDGEHLLEIGGTQKGIQKGESMHEIVFVAWRDRHGNERRNTLREADIAVGGYNPTTKAFEFFDMRRQPVSIQLRHFDEVLEPQDAGARPAKHAFPITMVEEFRRVWQLASWKQQFIVIDEAQHAVESYELSAPTGLPGNYLLVARCHDDRGGKHVVVLTEEGVEAGRFNPERQVFEFLDRYGMPVAIQLLRDDTVLVPDILTSPNATEKGDIVFVVVQEGGTSSELYVQQFATADDAHDYRVDCWKNGAYRTSPVVEVPRTLADHPDFDEAVQELLKAVQEVDGVEEEEA